MITSALVSFGHFLAFFALSATLVVQLVLLAETISIERAKRIRRASMIYLLSALMIFIFGGLRVYYFAKGADYYYGNIFFSIKLGVFLLIILLHIIPALRFHSWGSALSRGQAPALSVQQAKQLRLILHAELTGIVIILLSAALMAHGLDSF